MTEHGRSCIATGSPPWLPSFIGVVPQACLAHSVAPATDPEETLILGEACSHTVTHTLHGPKRAHVLHIAELLEQIKETGIAVNTEKHMAEAYVAGKACLLVFATHLFVVAYVHAQQLQTDARFVYAKETAYPHESRTVRFVRMLDLTVVLGTYVYMYVYAHV